MSKRQEIVKEWLRLVKDEGLSNAFIARRLRMTPQNLNYHLNESPELDFDLFKAIEKEIKKYMQVDETEPDNITKPINNEPEINPIEFENTIPTYKYPLLATVYAGEPKLLYHQHHDEISIFAYDRQNHRCFALKVNGSSMESTLKDGDEVLVDMDAALESGCLVAVILKNGHQYIKRYYDVNYAFVKLTSDNEEYGVRLIDKNDIIAIYRVVRINLKI
jgi:phage repressor protein C with HTH and peptisase S24 domain